MHTLPFFSKSMFLSPLVGLAVLVGTALCDAGDWASWRGPTQNGVSPEKNLPTSAKEFVWRNQSLGGHSTVAIYKGRVFGVNLAGVDPKDENNRVMNQEQLYCVDLATGKTIWRYHFNCFHTDVTDSRVGWSSPTVDPATGYIYVNGVEGLILCLNQEGELVWSNSSTERYGRISGYGGRTFTPLIDEDRVIVAFNNMSFGAHAVGAHRFLALNKMTGEIVWWASPGGRPEDPTYSSPIVAVISGERLVIAGNADGFLYAVKARTGEKAWGFMASKRGLNSSPAVDDYRVFISHSEENFDSTTMGRLVCLDGRKSGDITKTGEIWRCDGVDAGFASPLVHDGRIYVMTNGGILHCFDTVTGKKYWQFTAGRGGKGSPVWGDGKIYLTTENGTFVVLQDAGSSCKKIDEYTFVSDKGGVEIFSSPAVADGHIVFPTATELVCIGSKDFTPQTDPPLPTVDEGPADKTPATVLVQPAEVLLTPGEKIQFHAIAFDKVGRKIGPVEPKWTFPGKGSTLSSTGEFVAGSKGSIGEVSAELDGFKGVGRVRIVPNLPITEDFESCAVGDTVGWWVGATKMRFNVVDMDGSKVLKKLSDDRGPILNRALAFITQPMDANYTVEADVRSDEKKVKRIVMRGDVGVINSRYLFELSDHDDAARIVSWVPILRFEKHVDFDWKAGTWYRMKLTVIATPKEAKVYGKVWPRSEAEPKEWTVEGVDPQPNLAGAAGIYANSTNAPVYFDNVKVSR